MDVGMILPLVSAGLGVIATSISALLRELRTRRRVPKSEQGAPQIQIWIENSSEEEKIIVVGQGLDVDAIVNALEHARAEQEYDKDIVRGRDSLPEIGS
jgi:hypothetical protein